MYSILELINERLGGTTQKLTIYKDLGEDRVPLDPHMTLQEAGYEGGPKDLPQEVGLLYDFMTEFNDCPILTSDHYF